jgi:2-keto-4-pentenoate hydratase/2-oxohepta-3-ene-1,7-dioic acid hydratase in catechol pathway
VIGKPCKNVKPEDALSYVLGYTCANDISAGTGKKKKGEVSFAEVKVLIHFVRLVLV